MTVPPPMVIVFAVIVMSPLFPFVDVRTTLPLELNVLAAVSVMLPPSVRTMSPSRTMSSCVTL